MKRQLFFAAVVCLGWAQKSIRAGNINGKEVGTLVVGLILPKSGPQSEYGKEAYEGARLALEDLEVSYPGFAGMIRLETGDDRSTATGAKEAAEELIQKKRATILIGSVSPVSSNAIEELAKKAGVPHIIPADITLPAVNLSETAFRSSALERWQGHLLSVFAVANLKAKKVSVLFDPKDTLSRDVSETFLKHFEKHGGSLVSKVQYNHEKAEFGDRLSEVLRGKPDAILFPSPVASDVSEVMTRLRALKSDIPLLGLERWNRPALTRAAGPAWAGHYFVTSFTKDSGGQKVKHFVNRFKTTNKRYPGVLAAMAYDAMILAGDSFRRAQTTRPAELIRTIRRTTQAEGLSGPFSVNSHGFAEKSGAVMKTTDSGSSFQAIVSPDS